MTNPPGYDAYTAPGPHSGAAAHAAAVPEQPEPARPHAGHAGRSPIVAPGLLPALVTAALGALLAVAAPLGDVPLAAGVVLLQAVTAAGWFRLNGMWPARQGIALAFLSGLVTDAALLVTDAEHAPTVILGTLGVWCTLTVVLHLRNRSAPDERLYALTAALTSTALTVVAAGYLLEPTSTGAAAVVAGCAAVAVAAPVRALPLPSFVSVVLALLAAAGAGFGTAALTGADDVASGLVGLGAGVCALLGLRVASYDFPSRFVHMTAGVALPLTLAAPVVHLLGSALA